MRKYYKDKLSTLLVLLFMEGICVWLAITDDDGRPARMIINCLLVLVCMIFFSGRIMLIPLDFLFGVTTKNVIFLKEGIGSLDCLPDNYSNCCFCTWDFICIDNKKRLRLLVPVDAYENLEYDEILPQPNTKLQITYYRFARILKYYTVLELPKTEKHKSKKHK